MKPIDTNEVKTLEQARRLNSDIMNAAEPMEPTRYVILGFATKQVHVPGTSQAEERTIVRFAGEKKGLIISAKVSKRIAAIHGSKLADLIGKPVWVRTEPEPRSPNGLGLNVVDVETHRRLEAAHSQPETTTTEAEATLRDCKTLDALRREFLKLPKPLQAELEAVKDEMKAVLEGGAG